MQQEKPNKAFGASEFYLIIELVQTYFNGLHEGDAQSLRTIFHEDAFLKAPGLRKGLQQWLEEVATRPKPEKLGAQKNYRIRSIEIIQDQAIVTLECPLFDYNYFDCLSLLKEEGQWLIVNKMYTDLNKQ